MILHEIFRVVSRFPRYISCYIAESRSPLGQCAAATAVCLVYSRATSSQAQLLNTFYIQ